MSLKHIAPFSADYPTLGLLNVQPGQIVELAGRAAELAIASTMFEDNPEPIQPRKRTSKTKPAAAATDHDTEGNEHA